MKKNKIIKNKKIFGVYCNTNIIEFFGALHPNKITVLLLKKKRKIISAYKFPSNHVEEILVPKIGPGKFNNLNLMNLIDHFVYGLYNLFYLPKILTYDVILVGAPAYFDALFIPIYKLFGKKVVLFILDSQIETAKTYKHQWLKKPYYWLAWQYEKLAIKMSDFVFPYSRFVYNYSKKYNKNVIQSPTGADVKNIEKIKPKRMFKEFTITYLGGFEMWRGLDMLIEAFLEMKKAGFKGKLLLIGGGPDFDKVKKFAKNDKDIAFTGYTDHSKAISYCKGSDILAMVPRNIPASHAISSIKCFEYIACEVPTIVTNSGEHAYWIKKMNAGLVVKDNKKEIKEGLSKLVKDKKLYRFLKDNTRKNKHKVDYLKFKEPFVKEVLK